MRAFQIMTRNVITADPEMPIIEAARTMLRNHIGGLPVVDAKGKLVGIVSDGDFIRRTEIGTERQRGRWLGRLVGSNRMAAEFVHAHGRKVGEIMTPNPVTVTEDTPLEEIVRVMEAHNVKRLPVVAAGRLTGMVTYTDFVQTLANLAGEVPSPTVDDDKIREQIIAVIGNAVWKPCRYTVTVHHGVVHLVGVVRDERSRQAMVVAAEGVAGVKRIYDHLLVYPPPEEDLGGGDIVSLQEESSTEDDRPL